MTLLTIWDLLSGVFGFLVSIGVIMLLYILIAKLFNVKIVSRTGTVLASPKDYNNIKKSVENSASAIINFIKIREPKVEKILNEEKINKIEKLERLAKLKNELIISDEEFQILKKEVLNS